MEPIPVDIIGDIHGHADELCELLEKLGYDSQQQSYQHPEGRTVIFLGDFIDRGPEQLRTLDIARRMIQGGSAKAVMGNHEFNALAFHSRNCHGKWLRPHTEKNIAQHQRFLDEIAAAPDGALEESLDFFWKLPLWIETDSYRVVHATWSAEAMNTVLPLVNSDKTIVPCYLGQACDPRDAYFGAFESLLKGIEVKLPNGISFEDADGYTRDAVRIKWWKEGKTLGDLALFSEKLPASIRGLRIDSPLSTYGINEPPLFLGHYWYKDDSPAFDLPNVAIMDYSVAKGGKLIAYRLDPDSALSEENFVW